MTDELNLNPEVGEDRTPRATQTRGKDKRRTEWKKPDALPAPDPRPGWEHRWVRISSMGTDDPKNVSSKLREGWEMCKSKDYPEIEVLIAEEGRFKDNVVIGGLVLCRAPAELIRQRTANYKREARATVESMDNDFMRLNDPRMPAFSEKKTKVSFGSGNA